MVEMNFSCPERIDEMSPTNNGRFCDSCQKDIIDFTEMSNDEVHEQLKNVTSKTCGIFKKRQVMNSYRVELGSRFRLAFMLVFLLGVSSTDILAQDTLPIFPASIQKDLVADSIYRIKGQVLGADSLAAPFTKVWVEIDTAAGISNVAFAVADFDGNFSITFPNEIKGPFNLFAQSIGYEKIRIGGITFESGQNEIHLDLLFTEELEIQLIGIINICPLLIPSDPYEIGKTTLDGDDIRQWD